jgi:flagellar assembly factor FliW
MFHGDYAMTGSEPAIIGHPMMSQTGDEEETIESRFGAISVDPKRAIRFPNGLLGIPERTRFALTHCPSAKMARFKLLQSLEDYSLCFLTLPLDVANPIIEYADLEQAAKDLDMPMDALAVVLLVTVQREMGVAKISVNARAPVLIHSERRLAAQYVFPHTRYQIRQPLSL